MNAIVDLRATRTAAPIAASPYPATPSAVDRGGTPWDDRQRAWILDLRERGFTAEVVAAALGRSVETIYAQYQLIGSRVFVRRTWSAADAARAIARAEAGEPLKVVAADYGRSLDQLRGMFETRGYRPGRRADWRAEELATLRARLAAGDSCVAIGATLGRSAASVRQKAATLGLAPARAAAPAGRVGTRRVGEPAAAIGSGCRWDAAAEARLAALIAAEGPDALASVAAAMGSTPRMVRVKALALGLVPRKRARRGLTVEGEALVRRQAATTPVTALARQVGCDIRTLKAWAAAEGLVFAKSKRAASAPRPARPVRVAQPAAVAAPAAPVPPAPAAGSAWKARRLVAAPAPPRPAPVPETAAEAARGPAARVRFVARVEPVEADRFRRYRRPAAKAGRPADAAALLRDTGDAIAAFLATRGVTRVRLEPRAALEAAVRRRGYALVASGAGYLVDGHFALESLEALRAFAEARRIAA